MLFIVICCDGKQERGDFDECLEGLREMIARQRGRNPHSDAGFESAVFEAVRSSERTASCGRCPSVLQSDPLVPLHAGDVSSFLHPVFTNIYIQLFHKHSSRPEILTNLLVLW